MSSTLHTRRSFKERVFHALSFEGVAVLICAPVLAWSMGTNILHMGALTLMFSTAAMLWNMLFNLMFDRAQRRYGFVRTIKVRILHATLFELGLILAVVPLAAWWLSISLIEAFWLDIALILFFLPYTFGFNWLYDHLREGVLERRAALAQTQRTSQ